MDVSDGLPNAFRSPRSSEGARAEGSRWRPWWWLAPAGESGKLAETVAAGARLDRLLADAEDLIKHLAETRRGKLADDEKAASELIIRARLSRDPVWAKDAPGELLAALALLSSRVAPVTAETLRLCKDATGTVLRWYWVGTFALAVVILVLSIASFVTAGICKSVTERVGAANDLAVRLVAQIGVPGGEAPSAGGTVVEAPSAAATRAVAPRVDLADLQAFAAAARSVYQRAVLLDGLTPPVLRAQDPRIPAPELQLPVPLADPRAAASRMIQRYQDVRDFADMVRNHSELLYGAVGTIVLPVLYALLGALANLLRLFSRRVVERSYAPSYADYAHLLIAGIAGTVVGLFSNVVVGQGVSLPPLAIAFVAGYATDFFFSRLDNLLQRPAQPDAAPRDAAAADSRAAA